MDEKVTITIIGAVVEIFKCIFSSRHRKKRRNERRQKRETQKTES